MDDVQRTILFKRQHRGEVVVLGVLGDDPGTLAVQVRADLLEGMLMMLGQAATERADGYLVQGVQRVIDVLPGLPEDRIVEDTLEAAKATPPGLEFDRLLGDMRRARAPKPLVPTRDFGNKCKIYQPSAEVGMGRVGSPDLEEEDEEEE